MTPQAVGKKKGSSSPSGLIERMAEMGRGKDPYSGWRLEPLPEERGIKAHDAFERLERVSGSARDASARIRNEDFKGALKNLKSIQEEIERAIKDLSGSV